MGPVRVGVAVMTARTDVQQALRAVLVADLAAQLDDRELVRRAAREAVPHLVRLAVDDTEDGGDR